MFCSTCGCQLAEKAVVCPKCGCPTHNYEKPHVVSGSTAGRKSSSNNLISWLLVIGALVLFSPCFLCGGLAMIGSLFAPPPEPAKPKVEMAKRPVDFKMTAKELHDVFYTTDRQAADVLVGTTGSLRGYQGRRDRTEASLSEEDRIVARYKGKVFVVSGRVSSTFFNISKTTVYLETSPLSPMAAICCNFDDANKAQLEGLRPSQQIEVKGECTPSTVIGGREAALSDCIVVKR